MTRRPRIDTLFCRWRADTIGQIVPKVANRVPVSDGAALDDLQFEFYLLHGLLGVGQGFVQHPAVGYSAGMGYDIGDLASYQAADLHPVVSEAFADYLGNERAARAYQRLGFRAVRVLHYYLATVDARDHALCSWLERCGAELTLSQDEMVHESA